MQSSSLDKNLQCTIPITYHIQPLRCLLPLKVKESTQPVRFHSPAGPGGRVQRGAPRWGWLSSSPNRISGVHTTGGAVNTQAVSQTQCSPALRPTVSPMTGEEECSLFFFSYPRNKLDKFPFIFGAAEPWRQDKIPEIQTSHLYLIFR